MVSVTEDSIEINLVGWVKPYWINPTEGLDYVLRSLAHLSGNKKVYIRADKECPINTWPFKAMIDMIAESLGVASDRVTVIGSYVDFAHPKASLQRLPVFDRDDINFANQWIQHGDFQLNKDARLFGAFFGRSSMPRLILGHHLESRYPDLSCVNFLCAPDTAAHNLANLDNYFSHLADWLDERSNHHGNISADPLGIADDQDIVSRYADIWSKYRLEVVVETNYLARASFTEKTLKCLASGKPFIFMGGAGSLEFLRAKGFKTFQEFLDESYDEDPDWYSRLRRLTAEIDRIAALDQPQLVSLLENCDRLATHNRQHFFSHQQQWQT